MNDRILSIRRLFEGWMNLLVVQVRVRGHVLERALVEHPSGVQILLYDPERRVALVGKQLRLGVLHLDAAQLFEAMGGMTEGGDAEATAKQEAWEEAGVHVSDVEFAGHVWMTPSSTTERVHLYLAPYHAEDRVAAGGGVGDEHEHIELEEQPLAELWTQARSGAAFDAKLFMLLQALHLRQPDLFK
ncbi:NUDIX hydrolase [Sphingomonas sp. HITSZ_GF]|uniref:NUDIX domain-containing protein n=1 Tax=Sphingomonas sp. HITSZ_GF TaxID=3037247 RepID=UPI00240E51C9|nr:NUDIX hydrolase [Sphingomonas sp. HITSZ_GF]MDG2535808.1 NUDIX hydrolase [Sphingomonas sp. HITSZ_GF]